MEVTPVGKIVGFVAIEVPSTKFDDNGVYSCQMEFVGEAALEMKTKIDLAMAASLTAGSPRGIKRSANPPYTIQDKVLVVKFKQNAQIVKRDGEKIELDIKIYDTNAKLVDEPLYIGEGTTCKIAYTPYYWAVASTGCGCTLQPKMVQIIDLVKRENRSNPFDTVEGFTSAPKGNPFETAKTEPKLEEKISTSDDDFYF